METDGCRKKKMETDGFFSQAIPKSGIFLEKVSLLLETVSLKLEKLSLLLEKKQLFIGMI